MAQFGWAYVNCSDTTGSSGGQAAGPTGSIQFLTGSNATSGSARLRFFTASTDYYDANTLLLSGTLIVRGDLTASSFVVHETDVISGSTKFGNDTPDTHERTRSIFIGDGGAVTTFEVRPALSQSKTLGMRFNYRTINASGLSSSTGDYLIGFGGSGDLEFRLLSASVHNAGAILVLKDETTGPPGAITITASSPNTIDNNGSYVLSGSNPAISLYSNGSNWFVF